MREIEVKLKARDLKAVEKKLAADGCVLSMPIRQEDTVYTFKGDTSVWEGFKTGAIVLRIRKQNERTIFTLKQQRTNEMDNTELETEISEPEEMRKILLTLGYTPEVEVKKNRRKGKLKEYEICLDEVDGLGSFVELEKLTTDDADPVKVEEELLQTLEALGLSRKDKETRGYDTQIYQKKNGQKS